MPCHRFRWLTPSGDVAEGILCSRGGRRHRCAACGRLGADRQCDYPTPGRRSRTCDAYLCEDCAVHKGADLDYCPHHPPTIDPPEQQSLLEEPSR